MLNNVIIIINIVKDIEKKIKMAEFCGTQCTFS